MKQKNFLLSTISQSIFNREICNNKNNDNFELNFIDYRIKTLQASKFKTISVFSQNQASVSSMDFDNAETRFLLCGSSRGAISIVDFDQYSCDYKNQNYREMPVKPKYNHKYFVTCCQWYPIDSGLFVTGSMDKTVKLWDSNRFLAVDTFEFPAAISQTNWGIMNNSSLIAVAISSSNVHFIDPRSGNSIQHLRCKNSCINTVWWKRKSNFHLITGNETGKVCIWDIRSGRNELAQLKVPDSVIKKNINNGKSKALNTESIICVKDTIDGTKIISMSFNRILNCWDAESLRFESTINVDCKNLNPKNTAVFDVCNEGKKLWAFVPTDSNIEIREMKSKTKKEQFITKSLLDSSKNLKGHFYPVTACVYRNNYQQLVTSSADRLTLIWSPSIDEYCSENEEFLSKFHEDEFSDDEL